LSAHQRSEDWPPSRTPPSINSYRISSRVNIQEKTKTFKIYASLNATAIVAAFSCAAALIIVSATKHDAAVTECKVSWTRRAGLPTFPACDAEWSND